MKREDYHRLRHLRTPNVKRTEEEIKKLDEKAIRAWQNAVEKGEIKYISKRKIYYDWNTRKEDH